MKRCSASDWKSKDESWVKCRRPAVVSYWRADGYDFPMCAKHDDDHVRRVARNGNFARRVLAA